MPLVALYTGGILYISFVGVMAVALMLQNTLRQSMEASPDP
jgi:hypothetical protein